MPLITFLPDTKSLQVRPGTTVLDAAGKARVPIRVRCGGKASCLMCKVTVDPEQAAGSGLSQPERRAEARKPAGTRLPASLPGQNHRGYGRNASGRSAEERDPAAVGTPKGGG
ncbi:2Fe-2S iron-sulfur cluster binding domain-containing protein [Paenibacillus sp. P26]|nr:2Fe-2S iron-sulfur cluster binding domain-containing protein [Paenibacillus sp. P26]